MRMNGIPNNQFGPKKDTKWPPNEINNFGHKTKDLPFACRFIASTLPERYIYRK